MEIVIFDDIIIVMKFLCGEVERELRVDFVVIFY